MPTKIFLNLPVSDLNRSVQFFNAMGFRFNPQFTDEKATCMVITSDIFVMLLTEPFFKTFTRKEIADAKKSTEVITCLTVDSREQVDELYNKALQAGGSSARDGENNEWMYYKSFQDIDGHLWEIMYMSPSAINQA